MNLASRIVLIGLAGLVMFALLLFKGVEWSVEAIAEDSADTYLLAYADVLIPAIEIENHKARIATDSALIERIPRDWQISQDSVPLQYSSRLEQPLPIRPRTEDGLRFRHTTSGGRDMEAIQRDYFFPDGATVTVTFAMDAALLEGYVAEQRETLRDRLTPFLVFSALIAALLLTTQAVVVIWPLNRLRRDVSGLEQGKVSRLGSHYPGELSAVTEKLNAQLDRTETTLARYRQFAGNLAHAIKTPLTALRLDSTTAANQALLDNIDALVDRNLARVRIAGSSPANTVAVDAGELLQRLVRSYQKISDASIQLSVAPRLFFDGDTQDFVEALGNILENACRYATTTVAVVAANGRIEIHDDGAGVPKNEFVNVLDRGTRLDEAGPGTGIGLPIAREIVELYGGSVELRHSRYGGLQVTLLLPCLREGKAPKSMNFR